MPEINQTDQQTERQQRGIAPMFQDPTKGLTKFQQDMWQALVNGAAVNDEMYQQSSAYRDVVNLYREHTGQGGSTASREKYLALKRAEQDFYRTVAAEHVGRYRTNQATVDAAVLKVIDTEGDATPTDALLNAGVPADEVQRIRGKGGARRKVKRALAKHAEHPNAQRMIQNEGKREFMRMAHDTLAGSLEGIAVNMKTQARLARLEALAEEQQRINARQDVRIAELEARLAANDARHAIEDSGLDPKAEAIRLHADGLGYKAIARELGRSQSSVRNWIKAAA